MGWKEFFAHKRTWALIIGLLFQALIPIIGMASDNPNVAYLVEQAPYLLAALWTTLVLGIAYEDRISKGATSALTVLKADGPEGGWKYALVELIKNERFVATILGTVLAIVALCVPLWTGLEHLKEAFNRLAELIVLLASALTAGLSYSAAHDEQGAPSP